MSQKKEAQLQRQIRKYQALCAAYSKEKQGDGAKGVKATARGKMKK